jgi:hypothetical protein
MVVGVQDPVDALDAELRKVLEDVAAPEVDEKGAPSRGDDVDVARIREPEDPIGETLGAARTVLGTRRREAAGAQRARRGTQRAVSA